VSPTPAAKPTPAPTAESVCPTGIDKTTHKQKNGNPDRSPEQSYSDFTLSGVVAVVAVMLVVCVKLVVEILVVVVVVMVMLMYDLVVVVDLITVDT
jgi:hypothetical protein